MTGFLHVFHKAELYGAAALNSKLDEKLDARIQLDQAIEAAQQHHNALTQQAAQVIGGAKQLEMQLERAHGDVAAKQDQAGQALLLAQQASAAGDAAKAADFEQTAQVIANDLVMAEQHVTDLEAMYTQAKSAADKAKVAVADSTVQLQGYATERTNMINQLDQAKLQEQANAAIQQMNEVVNTADVPSLDAIRSKIEDRYAKALGGTELAQDSVQGRMLEVKRATANLQGAARLEQIRATLGSAPAQPAIAVGANE